MTVTTPYALRLLAGTVGLGACLVLGAALAQTPADKPVAKIDGQIITEGDLQIAADDIGQGLAQMPEAQRRDYLVAYVADLKLGAKAAIEAKIADTPAFQRKLSLLRDKLLVEAYLESEAQKSVTDEKMRQLYAESIKDAKPEPEIRARHILVETEDQAKAAAARVKAGEDFAKVAGELSKDSGSAKEGGDLGYFTKDRMVPEFADTAFKLDKGQVSDPVKSQFGWHVIKVEDKREKTPPSFDDVKDQVAQYLTRKTQSDIILAIRAKGKVERLDQPATPAAAPAGSATPPAPAAPAAEPKKP